MLHSSSFSTSPVYHKPAYLQVISLLAIGYLIYYLWWRVTSSLNPDAPFFSWISGPGGGIRCMQLRAVCMDDA